MVIMVLKLRSSSKLKCRQPNKKEKIKIADRSRELTEEIYSEIYLLSRLELLFCLLISCSAESKITLSLLLRNDYTFLLELGSFGLPSLSTSSLWVFYQVKNIIFELFIFSIKKNIVSLH